MNPLFLLAFWMMGWRPAAPAVSQNVVRICSLAAAGSCTDFDARPLDPTLPASRGGQMAFLDPETKALVQPSAAQAEELALAVSLEESRAQREPARVETLPDGTLKLGPGSLFTVDLKAAVRPVDRKP
jgi:hypothetical protein